MMIDIVYNKHYIKADGAGRIVESWSDGPCPDNDTEGAICINEHGGNQFRLFPGGEENPALYDGRGIPLYKWDGARVSARSQEEIDADYAAMPEPNPTEQEQMRADIDFLAAMQGVKL